MLQTTFRRIAFLLRPVRSRIYGGIALSVLATAMGTVTPLAVRALVDLGVTGGHGLATLDEIALGLLALFVAQSSVGFAASYVLSFTGERVIADLRKRLYEHMHTLSLRFFYRQRVGDLTSRLASDVQSIRVAATDAVAQLVAIVVRIVGSGSLMLVISWRLSLLILLVSPLGSLTARHFGGRLRELARGVQDRLADTTAMVEETLSCIGVVVAFARGDHETRRYAQAVDALFQKARQQAYYNALFTAIMTVIFLFPIAAIFWYGGREMAAHRLTPGGLVAAFFYATAISQGISSLAALYGTFTAALGASGRIFELLDEQPDVRDNADAAPLRVDRGTLHFDGVSFGYQDQVPVLQGITFTVEAGETVAVVGPSGGGKTTMLNLILRLFEADVGRILIDGHDVREVTLQSLRNQIAYVPQNVQLFNDSIRENIRYGRPDATDQDIEEAARAADAHDFIATLAQGYSTIVGERGVKLSGGQRQRIAIARAFLRRAPILLLDEPTSSLDSAAECHIKQALDQFYWKPTTIVVAHRLATVRDATRIIVIDQGCVQQAGTHADLITEDGLYRRSALQQFIGAGGTEEVGCG